MRLMTKTMIALGFVGTLAVGGASPSLAQGFYFQGPGVEFGVGRPWHGHRYYRYYDRPYAYYGPRVYRHHYYRHHWDW